MLISLLLYDCQDTTIQETEIKISEQDVINFLEIESNAKLAAEVISQFANDKEAQKNH
jgi:hypothetical protein